MNINDYLETNIDSVKSITDEFNNKEFSSHDFIEKFIGRFESDYIEMLVKHQNSGHAFQTVHQSIAKFLTNKMSILQIKKTQTKDSENVRGNITLVQYWIKK